MASTKLNRTFGSGNRLKWTWSGWIKRSGLGSNQCIFSAYENSTNFTICSFESDDQLRFGDESSGNTNGRIISNMTFRDTSAWYHLVFVFDKDNSTSGDKIKMYVNGERITSFSDTGNVPSDTGQMNNSSLGRPHEIGCVNNSDFFNGYMSHIHFCDGYAYLPSDFGETDSTTGIWKAKSSPSVNYGTTGYFILKDGNSVTDSSSNTNNWTVAGGTLIDAKDCPSNVFATMNPLQDTEVSLSNGSVLHSNTNNTIQFTNTSGNGLILSTLGVNSGKYYCEAEADALGGAYMGIGILSDLQSTNIYNSNSYTGKYSEGWHFSPFSGNNLLNNDSWSSYGSEYVAGDIIGIALDGDNNKLYFSINGVWQNSGTGISITSDRTWLFGCSGNNNCIVKWNFGNGYFGTTQLTGTTYQGADGKGIFKYNPNNITLDSTTKSFKSLSTNGLNT